MGWKRIVGILLVIGGIACLYISSYIKSEVEQGKGEISRGQKKVDQTQGVFSLSPYTKEVGKGITSSGQSRIDEGKTQVAKYEQIAGWYQTGGIILIVAGAGLVVFGKKSKKK